MDSKEMIEKVQTSQKMAGNTAADKNAEQVLNDVKAEAPAQKKSRRKTAEDNIRGNMPPTDVEDTKEFEELNKVNREKFENTYKKLSKSSKIQWGKHWFTYNSAPMKEVKRSLGDLTELFKKPIDVENMSPEDISREMTAAYQRVIDDAKTYLGQRTAPHSDEGKKRKQYVEDIEKSCRYELSRLTPSIQEALRSYWLKKENNQRLKLTYGDILRHCRGTRIVAKNKRLAGGNNSTVVRISGKQLFKKAEKIEYLKFDNVKSKIEAINSRIISADEDGIPDSSCECITEFSEKLLNIIDTYFQGKPDDKTYEKDIMEGLMNLLTSKDRKGAFGCLEYIREKLKENLKLDGASSLNDEIDELEKEYGFTRNPQGVAAENKEKMREALKNDYYHELNATLVAVYNHIHEGADMTTRNVAMNRINENVLKFDKKNLIESQLAIVEMDNKEEEGIIMSNAGGFPLSELPKKINKYFVNKCRITPEAAKQLIQIQILDMICGQCDRHHGNIYAQIDEDRLYHNSELVILGFTGIDNDMAFGTIGKNLVKGGFNRMSYLLKSNGELAFKHIDRDTFEKIMNIDDTNVKYQLADLGFNGEELNSLLERIHFVKDELGKMGDKPGFIIEDYTGVGNMTDIFDTEEKDERGKEKYTLIGYLKGIDISKVA